MPSARLVEEGQKTIREVTITTRNWNCIRHTGIRRKANTNITKQALEWSPQRQRKHGKLKNTWLGVLTDLKKLTKSGERQKPSTTTEGDCNHPASCGTHPAVCKQVNILLFLLIVMMLNKIRKLRYPHHVYPHKCYLIILFLYPNSTRTKGSSFKGGWLLMRSSKPMESLYW